MENQTKNLQINIDCVERNDQECSFFEEISEQLNENNLRSQINADVMQKYEVQQGIRSQIELNESYHSLLNDELEYSFNIETYQNVNESKTSSKFQRSGSKEVSTSVDCLRLHEKSSIQEYLNRSIHQAKGKQSIPQQSIAKMNNQLSILEKQLQQNIHLKRQQARQHQSKENINRKLFKRIPANFSNHQPTASTQNNKQNKSMNLGVLKSSQCSEITSNELQQIKQYSEELYEIYLESYRLLLRQNEVNKVLVSEIDELAKTMEINSKLERELEDEYQKETIKIEEIEVEARRREVEILNQLRLDSLKPFARPSSSKR